MGVKGLTSFIARNAEQYMKPFELHDCNLIIDGDSLACNLYKDVSECNSAFGGDYDKYYRTIINFFNLMKQCNIRCFVLLDGGYEPKKLKTVQSRLRGKISLLKHINPSNSLPLFPLMMREVFIDALKDLEISFMRCELEADEQLASLARYLNCPVLSYDSDFYVFNVKYIPLITLRMKVLQKKENKMNQRQELRFCEARNLKKKQHMNQGKSITIEDVNINKKSKVKTINYLECCLYKIEYLLDKGKLDKEKLPLFAALLGNDYINAKIFNSFYSQVGLRGVSKKIPKHQKRIMVILKWLRYESKETATEKILSRMKKAQRATLLCQMDEATNGYLNDKCLAFNYFNLSDNDRTIDDTEQEDTTDDEIECETIIDEIEYETIVNEIESDVVSDDIFSEHDICAEKIFCSDDEKNKQKSDEECVEKNFDVQNSEYQNNLDIEKTRYSREPKKIPEDILRKIHGGAFPRYVSDLLNLRLYINNPQVENFLYPDCNEIAIPILLRIFAYLHEPEKPDLSYLTRVTRLTNCIYKKFSIESLNLNKENVLEKLLASVKINLNELVQDLASFPSDIRYYLIALLYWGNKSEYCDDSHIHALLICLVTQRFIDNKIEPIRNEKSFHKLYGKKIQKEKQLRNQQEDSTEISDDLKICKTKELLNKLSVYEKINYIPKIEILLLQENLLKYYEYREDFRKSHTQFSSMIIHGFSEFQTVIYQMYTLNALLDYPFDQIKISNLYSGLFLFNIYTNLQQRIDIQHHIRNFIFRGSEIVFEYYKTLGELCEKYIESFKLINDIPKNELSKKVKKKILQKNKKINKAESLLEKTIDMNSNLESKNESENEEIVLLNNKFGVLSI